MEEGEIPSLCRNGYSPTHPKEYPEAGKHMYASSESTLPSSGFGSETWFNQTFNFDIERQKVMSVIEEGINPFSVITWLKHEVTTFLTEWGVGREALTVQPATSYDITIIDGKPNIFAHSLNEFGEQLESYLNFDAMPKSISKGLEQAFITLSTLSPGEGVAILSPKELYRKYNSPGDVINPLLVTQVERDENGNATKVYAKGWFLFINRKLTPEERHHWFEHHQESPNPTNTNNPESIVSKPQYWKSSNYETSEEDSPVVEYIHGLNLDFIRKFDHPLFPSKNETGLRNVIQKNVNKELNALKEFLVKQEKGGFLQKLWLLMQAGQKTWAELMDVDFDWYWSQVLRGQIQIMGFHPAGDSDDIFSNDGADSLFDKSSNHCKKHGRFRGDHCPKCDK